MGFMFNLVGRLVEQDEEFDYENATLRAEQVEDIRIQKVRVTVDRDTVDPVKEDLPPGEGETD